MRKGPAKKRIIAPDAIYNSVLVSKLINRIMMSGKKRVAEGIVYSAFDMLKTLKLDPLVVLQSAIDNAKPAIELRTRKVGGARYQVPTKLTDERAITLALRWLVMYARTKHKDKTMASKLKAELHAASKNEGETIKQKETIHKMAEANRAFAYFSW